MMRTLAIGDIHGCLKSLNTLLDLIQPTPEDLLITLGDYVDRGPCSRGVLDRLIEMFEAGRVIPLRGNHDEMMVLSRFNLTERGMWLRFGGKETLDSYGQWVGDEDYDRVPERHWHFLEHELRNYYETRTHLFVHAMAHPDRPLAEQDTQVLLWERLFAPVSHASGKILVCGHTRQSSGMPLYLGSTICIDTAAYERQGWLTCLHAETGQYWQANEYGETRTAMLASS
jgi:serine/threonine protein phosphatase 1